MTKLLNMITTFSSWCTPLSGGWSSQEWVEASTWCPVGYCGPGWSSSEVLVVITVIMYMLYLPPGIVQACNPLCEWGETARVPSWQRGGDAKTILRYWRTDKELCLAALFPLSFPLRTRLYCKGKPCACAHMVRLISSHAAERRGERSGRYIM